MTFADLKRFVEEQAARGLHGTTPVTVRGRRLERIRVEHGTASVAVDLAPGLIVVHEDDEPASD